MIDMLLMTDRCLLTRFLHDAWDRPRYMGEKAGVKKKKVVNKASVLNFSCFRPEWSNSRNCLSLH